MSPLRLLKFGLIAVMACIVGAAVYVSTLVRERQEMLGKVARYNTSWLAGQALGEFMRFEARVAQYGVPGANLDKDEVHLRFDILVNRFDLLLQGDVRQFIDSSPEHRETVAQIRQAIRTIEPLIDRLDEPGVVNRVLNLLSPFDAELVGLASAANRFGGDRVSTDQRELMELHWAFSGFVAALLGGGMGLIVLLLWHNNALTRTGKELDASTRRISAQSDEIALVNEALEIRNGRFDAALRNMSQGLCLTSPDSRLVVCNQRFLQLFGIPEEVATPGTPVVTLVEAAVSAQALSETHLREIFSRQRSLGVTANAGSFDSEDVDGRTIAITQRPMEDGGWISTYEDVTDRRRAESQIAYMAHHDALTGLANRVLFREHLEQAALRARRSGDKVVVLYLDLDQFKDVNDTLGHPIGDLLLKAVAERLRLCLHESDFVARLGGDEFAILHCVHGGAHDSSALATRIVEQLGQPFDIDGHQVNIGTSIGIAIAAGDETPDQLLKNADMALYKAKSDGRRTFRYFEPAMDEALQARRALELDLRKALAADELELYYQPIVGLKAGTISGFEALMRWRHPVRGFVPPSEFVPIAEETGLIVALGAWTLRQACAQAASWPSHVKIAVNLSPVQFKTRGLVETITVALGASGVAASRLELEITESVLLQENDSTLATLHQIRELGVRIAMDDFGTGYSSLSYLRSFPFDKIKVDRCFVEELSEESNSAAIIRSVVELGATLGMTTTAEGIETPEQLRLLREAGCDEGQGYLLARPMPFAQTLDTVARERGIAHAA